MRARIIFPLLLAVSAIPCAAQSVQKVPMNTKDAPVLPEDLFTLSPGAWTFARQLWKGRDPCTSDQCEAGYNAADLAVSVERSKTFLRIVAGFRGCESVAWSEYEVGDKASGRDNKTIGKRIAKVIAASAKQCKVAAPSVPALDATRLYPITVN